MKSLFLRMHPAALVVLSAVFFGLAVMLCHWLLEDNRVYWRFSGIIKTYERVEHDDGSWEARRVAEPFTSPSEGNMLSWDAAHYDEIRSNLYDPASSWHGNYAFYPLFPIMWRLSGLSPLGISVVNWMLYVIGLLLVALIFGDHLPRWCYLLPLCAPMAVIFMIPYSEALFFVGIAAGMFGYKKERYWIYFLGFFVATLTRAAGNILVVAWIIVDVLVALSARLTLKETLCKIAGHLAPIVAGVLAVMLLQHIRGAEHWFEYVIAQREWGKELSWPTWPLTDWSEEGKSVTQPLLFMLFLPAMLWLALKLRNLLTAKTSQEMDISEQLRLLSVLFFVGNVILALFTQHGCLFSQARLLTCTPFFVYLLLDLSAADTPKMWRWIMLAAMAVAAWLCVEMFPQSSMIGCWLVFSLAAQVFYGRTMRPWLRYTLLGVTIAVNIYWTAYLFNCFLTDGWIFT